MTTLLNDWIYEGILGAADGHRLALRRPWDLWILAGFEMGS